MPFIPENEREAAKNRNLDEAGHKCFRHYADFMRMWREVPRWRTIDEYARRVWSDDEQRAAGLALLVFMALHGMNYELKQQKTNGDI